MAFDFPASPTTGQIYSPTNGPSYVWSGTAWRTVGPGSQFNRAVFTATANQTVFSAPYVIGAFDVFRNGVKLAAADFTATDGATITLANPCMAGDTVEVIAYSQITYADAVKRTGDTMTGALVVPAGATGSQAPRVSEVVKKSGDTMTGALAVPSLTVNSVPVLAGPAFSAYQSSSQTISSATNTKVLFQTKEFDTNTNYDTSTSRFTPTVSGYYQINAYVTLNTTVSPFIVYIFKNGYVYKTVYNSNSANTSSGGGSIIVQLNGSSDYVEVYVYLYTGQALNATTFTTFFQGTLVRAA